MTLFRTSLFGVLGFFAAAAVTPASAGVLSSVQPAIAQSTAAQQAVDGEELGALHLIGDRGSWKKKKRRYRDGFDYGRYDDRHHRKHFKKKKRRHVFKRGFRRGYDRGYDEGYYEGRRYSRSRHHHHRRYRDDRFRGGIYFGDGYGGGFRFRY